MKKQIVLDEEDVRQTIANAYNVDKDKVSLEIVIVTEGCGVSEHLVKRTKVTVEVPMNDQR